MDKRPRGERPMTRTLLRGLPTTLEGTSQITVLCVTLALSVIGPAFAQPEGRTALDEFRRWKDQPANAALPWSDALSSYRQKLKAGGATDDAADRTIRLIVAYDEAELYNRLYAAEPQFRTDPNRLLAEAVKRVTPGKALDVGMGQGRNAIFLAREGWDVTGFDVAEVGLQKATEQAAGLMPAPARVDPEAVLNGIAYDADGDRVFVTGKLWPRLFEIEVVPRE